MTISIIQLRDLGGYKEITMYRSCSCWDPEYINS